MVVGGLPEDLTPNAAVLVSGGSGTINVPGGFPAAFLFYYVGGGGEVSVYSDLNGGGQLLGSFDINTPYPPDEFNPVGRSFSGTGESVVFSNIDASVTIDNMGFGGLVIPEPASMLLFSTGLVGIAAWRRRRQGPANGSSE